MGGAKLIHAGCWAHASRYFFQAVEAHPDDRAAIALVATIDELFAKNAIRPVALGRKNWIHFGSQDAGPRIAAILSIVESCRRLKIPIRDYLRSTLPGLANFPINRIAELTPTGWLARN